MNAVTSITGPARGEDRTDFTVASGGQISLNGLKSTNGTGPVQMNVSVPVFSLPELMDGTRLNLNVATGSVVNLPKLTQVIGGNIAMSNGATINAPLLTTFTNSLLTLGQGQTLNAPSFTNVDNNRFILTGGAQLTVMATSYRSDGVGANATLISVDQANSKLSFPVLQTFNDGIFDSIGDITRHLVTATNGGVIEMNAVTSITGPARGEDRTDFTVAGGGQINMNSLVAIDGTGTTRFDLIGGTITLGSVSGSNTDVAVHAGGLLHVLGNFAMDANRSVTVDIIGTAISQFGRIQVDGIAAIIGTLNIARPTGFIPSAGDAFPILTYTNGHTGTFGTVTGTPAGPRTFNLAYNATALTLNVT